jgi:hypothetical protein
MRIEEEGEVLQKSTRIDLVQVGDPEPGQNRTGFRQQMQRWRRHIAGVRYNSSDSGLKKEIPA